MRHNTSEATHSSKADAQQQALLEIAVTHGSAIFYVADLSSERPFRYISPNVEAVTGHEAKPFMEAASYAARHVHPDDLAAYKANIHALTGKGAKESSRTQEFRFATSAGDYRWFRDEMRIVETLKGKTERVGCMIDITSEKQAALEYHDTEAERMRREEEIRQVQETLEDAIDSLSEGFTLFDAEDRLIMCNSRFKEFNEAHGDLLVPGNKWVDIAQGMARRGVFKSALGRVDQWLKKRQTRRGRVHNEEFELTDGRWIEYSHRQTRQGGIVTTWRDITERKKMEQALRDNEELVRLVVEDCPLPIVMTRADDGKILFESPASKAAFGNNPDDASGTVRSRYDDPDCRAEYLEELRKRGAVDSYEILFRRHDGGVFVGAVSARLVEYRGEEAIVSTTIDLTERNRRENELRHAREILEDAIEALSDGIVLYDADDRLVICNSQYKNYHGDSADLLVPGADWREVTRKRGERGFFATAGSDIDTWLEGQMAQRGVAQNQEFLAEGGRWFAYSHRPTRQGGFVSTWRDITEQKKVERELRDREALVRQVLEACPLPVRMWNFDSGLVLYESPACRKIFGRDSTMDGKKADPSVYVNYNDRVRYREHLEKAGSVDHMEMELRRLLGATFWASVSAQMIEYKGERVVVSSIVDLTERKMMEQAIGEREEQFRHIVEGHPLPVWMVDIETARIIYESPAAAAIVGRDWPSPEPGYSTDYFADPAERGPINERLRRTGELTDVECRFKKADGTVFWVSLNDKLIEYDGREVSITGFVDLTERKQREAELQRARETLEDAIESLPDGFSLFDADHTLIMCNSKFKEYNPLSADALTPGTRWQDFIRVGAERGQYQEAVGREAVWIKDRLKYGSLGTGGEGGVEFQQSDGRWYHAFSQSTRQGGYVGIRVDITERKKMEDSLRHSEALVRQVLEACPVPITMNYASDGIIIYESPAAQSLLNYERPQEGRSVIERWGDPRERKTYLTRLRRDRAVDGLEVRYKKADGEEFPCSLSSRLIDYHGADVIVSSILDLTERKAAESELERQREMLHQSEKLSALGELLAGVSHELNNPLSVLLGQAMMLQETTEDPEIKARADKIGNAADRCARIVKSFLAMARQEPTRTEPVDLNTIIEEALEVTGYSLRTTDIDLVWRAAGELPPVLADPDQMRQVFTNLIVNAQHALEAVDTRRQLRIITSYRKTRNEVVVKVKDNGPGVPASVRSRIFEPLYTTKEIGSGTGMGLALCHRIVEAHGGTIELESRTGEGAAFAIRLPCADRQEPARPIPEPGPRPAGGYQVLVVDDEFDVGQIISDVLAHEGHSVEVAQSGRLALEKIKRRRYDVVLSDIRMPNMDGPTLYQAIQDTRPDQIEGLAFITGDTLSPRVKEFLDASQRPYLEKPIAPKEIRDLVDLLMRRKAN
jgi:PAS domain S-box-containing protein